MRLPIFLVAAIVLIVFAIIAGAATSGTCLGSSWFIWVAASFLAYLTNLLFGGYGYAKGAWGRDSQGNPVP
jgi:predicted Na+-dependent transporter